MEHGSIYGDEDLETHACQICHIKLSWESISLVPHIEQKHKMDVEQYRTDFMSTYNDNPQDSVKQDKDEHEVLENEEIKKWAAGSLYLCLVCDQKIPGKEHFIDHLGTEHKILYKDYLNDYKDAKQLNTFGRGYHFCRICSKNVMWDKQHLVKHMKEDHNMTISNYFETNPNKNKLPKLAKLEEQMNRKIAEYKDSLATE